MRRICFAALFVCLPALVSAQTHPCDQTAPSTYQIRRNEAGRVGFCHAPQEEDGTPITLGQIRFVAINATTSQIVLDFGLMQPQTGANAAGLYYYESAPQFFAADLSLAVIAEFNGLPSLPSTPIVIDVRGGPKAPTGLRVVIP